jgi:hypothetical protein
MPPLYFANTKKSCWFPGGTAECEALADNGSIVSETMVSSDGAPHPSHNRVENTKKNRTNRITNFPLEF